MDKTALLIIDVQNDFLPPSGSLAVPNGREVLPVIEELLDPRWGWGVVVASQDYHPPNHISFASNHPPHAAFAPLPLVNAYGESYIQTLWPDHCVQGSPGAEIEKGLGEALVKRGGVRLVRKGIHHGLEAYSAFQGTLLPEPYPSIEMPASQEFTEDTEGVPPRSSELAEFLRAEGVERVVVVGLATDFCVLQTALSALATPFPTLLLSPGTRGISPEDEVKAFEAVEKLGGVVAGRDGGDWEEEVRRWVG
ncbi:hypothetical protein IAT38_008193 [Cryptococcus sp. DSM 104549]